MAFTLVDKKGPVQGEGEIHYSMDDDTEREILRLPVAQGEMLNFDLQSVVGDFEAFVAGTGSFTGQIRRETGSDIELMTFTLQLSSLNGMALDMAVNVNEQALIVKATGVVATPVTGKLFYKYTYKLPA